MSLLGSSNELSKSQNSSTKCPIYSNININEMQMDELDNDNTKKRSKYNDLKFKDQKSFFQI